MSPYRPSGSRVSRNAFRCPQPALLSPRTRRAVTSSAPGETRILLDTALPRLGYILSCDRTRPSSRLCCSQLAEHWPPKSYGLKKKKYKIKLDGVNIRVVSKC